MTSPSELIEVPVRSSLPARRVSRAGRGVRGLLTALPFIGLKTILFATFIVVPFFYTIVLTFQRGNLLAGMRWTGIDNYLTIFSDTLFWGSLRNTLFYLVVSVPTTLIVSCAVGLLLASRIRGMKVHRSLIYTPALLSIVGTGLIWKVMVDPEQGPLALFFSKVLGINVPWTTNGTVAILFVGLITVWSACGLYSLIFMAGFNSVPEEVLEAARIDGASRWQVLTQIKLPLITPVMQVVLVLMTIGAIQVFDLIFVITKGGPGTATYTAMWYVYQQAFNGGSIAYAATMSVVLLLITLAISATFLLRRNKGNDLA